MSSDPYQPPACLAAHLAVLMNDVRTRFALHASRNPLLAPIVGLIWNYLGRAARRLERLIARRAAGRLAPRRAGEAGVRAPRSRPAAEWHVPGGHGWLIHMVQPCAQYIGQFEVFLARPELAELLAAVPQAGRILCPLCRMFAMRPLPPVLRRPAPTLAPATTKTATTRPVAPPRPARGIRPEARSFAPRKPRGFLPA